MKIIFILFPANKEANIETSMNYSNIFETLSVCDLFLFRVNVQQVQSEMIQCQHLFRFIRNVYDILWFWAK